MWGGVLVILRHGEYRLTPSGHKLQVLQASGLQSEGHPSKIGRLPQSSLQGAGRRELALFEGRLVQSLGPKTPKTGWEEGW